MQVRTLRHIAQFRPMESTGKPATTDWKHVRLSFSSANCKEEPSTGRIIIAICLLLPLLHLAEVGGVGGEVVMAAAGRAGMVK